MPFEGVGPYFPTVGGGVGASNDKIVNALPAVDSSQSCRWTSGEAQSYKLVKPGVTLVTTAAGAGPNDFGWNVEAADMDASANLPANRRIPSGTWTFNCVLLGSATSINNVWKIRVRIHKRSSGGALTEQGTAESSVHLLALTEQAYAISVASVPEIILAAGETIQVEYNINGQGAAVGNFDATFRTGNATLVADADMTLPGDGLRYNYPRSMSAALSLAVATTRRTALAAKSVAVSLSTAISRKVSKSAVAALSLATAIAKRVSPNAKSSALSLSTATSKRVSPNAKSSALALSAQRGPTQVTKPFSASLSLAAAMSRTITAFRSFSVSLSLGTAFARALIAARSFSVPLSLAVRGRIDMGLDVLNRISGGVRRVINYIFDD